MIQNLAKSIRFGREFSLRTIFRYRAIGCCRNSGASQRIMGTVRFESVAPNISFSAVQISPLPILSTALAVTLLSICENSSSGKLNEHQQSGYLQEHRYLLPLPHMGFLTLNQTRKLVYLLESDDSISRIPIVGVWVCLSSADIGSTQSVQSILSHPFVWGAFIRYVCSNHIKRRAQLEDDSFLLVRINLTVIIFIN